MNQPLRIFVVGHHGAGKALLAKNVAQSLGWRFIDADLGLESHTGRHLSEVLGSEGSHAFYDCQFEILASLCTQEHIVVTTDPSKQLKKLHAKPMFPIGQLKELLPN